MRKGKTIKLIISVIAIILFVVVLLIINVPDIGQKFPDMGNRHIGSVEATHESYNSNPPTSGPHVENIAPWGVSREIVPDELQVHNLEDGGIVIQYNPDKISGEEINQLEQIVNDSTRSHLLLAPRYEMEYKIVLTAWTRLLSLDSIDGVMIKEFIATYEGKDHHK